MATTDETRTVSVMAERYTPDSMFLREVVVEGTTEIGDQTVAIELAQTGGGLIFSLGKIGDNGRVVLGVGWKVLTQALADEALRVLADDKEGEPRG